MTAPKPTLAEVSELSKLRKDADAYHDACYWYSDALARKLPHEHARAEMFDAALRLAQRARNWLVANRPALEAIPAGTVVDLGVWSATDFDPPALFRSAQEPEPNQWLAEHFDDLTGLHLKPNARYRVRVVLEDAGALTKEPKNG